MATYHGRIESLAERLAARVPVTVDDPGRKLAAVAVILALDPGSMLFIRRAERAGDRWSGQMAFPGGRWSPGDPDLEHTARRETLEEVGVDLATARVLGRVDDIAPRTPVLPPIIVRPYVFAVPVECPLVPNQEVAATEWIGLDRLIEQGVYRPYSFTYNGITAELPGYHLEPGVVWGMTERILTPLLGLMDLGAGLGREAVPE